MSKVKEIKLKVIPAKLANEFVKKYHYSGKVVPNSNLHFGCFLDGKLHGVLSYGPSFNKKGTINLVEGTGWNEFIELNRMAFDDYLPRNSESRCIAISIRLIKKHAPHIRWVISFADATQCGDGTIYRASGFKLVEIAKSQSLIKFDGEVMHAKVLWDRCLVASWNPRDDELEGLRQKGHEVERMEGHQIKYVYLIDKSCKINRDILQFSALEEAGARMYKGEKI